MSNTAQTTATTRVPMDSTRKTALVAGIFYLITFVSIPTLVPPALYSSVTGKDFIISSGTDTAAPWGGFLEVIVALADAPEPSRCSAPPDERPALTSREPADQPGPAHHGPRPAPQPQ